MLAALLVFLAVLLPGLSRLRLRTDGRSLVPIDAPEASVERSIRDDFGVLDPLVAVVETGATEGIFNARTLQHVVELTRAFESVPGVEPESVVSLATEPGDHVYPGTLDFRTWLDPLPASEQEWKDLRAGLERAGIYRGTLLSIDSPPSATGILIGVGDSVDRPALCRAVRAAIDAHDVPGERVLLVGAPIVETELGEHLLEDLAKLVPIAFVVMGAILYVSFRRLWMVVLPLAGVGVSLLATLAVMGWCGVPVYLTGLVVPVILTAVGVAYSVHVCNRYVYNSARSPGADRTQVLRMTVAEMRRPVIGAALTTAVGFLSFALSPLAAVRAFGLAMAGGTILCMLWALFAVPACLALLPAGREEQIAVGAGARTREKLAARLEDWMAGLLARRRLVLALFAAVVVAALLGAARVTVQDSWVEGFSAESALRRDTDHVDRRFAGTHLLRVRLASAAPTSRGRLTRAAFDGQSVLLPGVLAESPRVFVHGSFELRGADYPLRFLIVDARIENGATRLFLSNLDLPEVNVRDLLPHGVAEFDYELDARDRWRQPAMLAELDLFEQHVAAKTEVGVGTVLGPWSQLSTLNAMLGADPARVRETLSERKGIERTFDLYLRARGERRLREVFSPAFDRALVTVLVRGANYASVSKLCADLRAYERERLTPLGIRLDLGGDLALSQTMISGIVSTQVRSLVVSLAGILAMAVLLTRSLTVALCLTAPCATAVLVSFGAMGWLGIPLGVATSMFAGILVGVGDDYAIHLWEELRRRTELRPDVALAAAMGAVGPAIVVDALSLSAGFGVLLFSQVPTNARLAALLVLSIASCLAASLSALPMLLHTAPRMWPGAGSRARAGT